jgi:hypothetical protein
VLRRLLILLAWIVAGGVAGAAAGGLFLLGERCAGPVCAGLIVIPMMTAAPGAVIGAVIGVVAWLRARS